MATILQIASFIKDAYLREFGRDIDQMSLHKLLYFAQRESYARSDQPLFPEDMVAAPYGPMSLEVHAAYKKGKWPEAASDVFSPSEAEILLSTVGYYGRKAPWRLSEISHGEISWKNARDRSNPDLPKVYPVMLKGDIRKDGMKILWRMEQAKARYGRYI